MLRNGEDYWYARTARKRHLCQSEHPDVGCQIRIAVGTRYVEAKLPPNSDIGNRDWWRMKLCVPCASRFHRDLVEQLGLVEAVSR